MAIVALACPPAKCLSVLVVDQCHLRFMNSGRITVLSWRHGVVPYVYRGSSGRCELHRYMNALAPALVLDSSFAVRLFSCAHLSLSHSFLCASFLFLFSSFLHFWRWSSPVNSNIKPPGLYPSP